MNMIMNTIKKTAVSWDDDRNNTSNLSLTENLVSQKNFTQPPQLKILQFEELVQGLSNSFAVSQLP